MSGERSSQDEPRFDYIESGLPDRAALEKVLSETLSDKPAEPLHDRELQALLSVAKRHRNAAISLEPIVVELVESILRSRLMRVEAPAEYWREMSLAIATTLFETPAVKTRLTGLWSSLLEVAK